jgi:arylsulfatase A-like enzyme
LTPDPPPRLDASRPNVVLFVVDDMGWADSRAYGSTYYETPNIDRLASEGMRFTDAYSASPVCSPTRASILTGKYPARLGITAAGGHLSPQHPDSPPYPDSAPPTRRVIAPFSRRFLDPREHTLPKALRAAGYRTAHFGKWHLGGRRRHWPEHHFDVAWHGKPDPGPPRPNGYFSPYSFRAGTITPGPPGEYLVDRLTDEALAFIDANRDAPFMLNVWQFGVHAPWDHKVEYTEQFARKRDPTGRHRNPIMASMLKSVDESVGRIVDRLAELGLYERTVILFTSDHGGNVTSNAGGNWKLLAWDDRRREDWLRWAGDEPPTSNAPLRAGKASLYEGGIRVPLIATSPGLIRAGTSSDEVVMSIDFYPTLLDLLGLEKPADVEFDGISFAPLLRDPAARLERDAVFAFLPHEYPLVRPAAATRQGRWKLIRWLDVTAPEPVHELYDLGDDLGEQENLSERRPEVVERLDGLIDGFVRATGALLPRPNPDYDPDA